jgi:hypothetical protein
MNPLYQSLINLQQRLDRAGIASAVIGGIAVGAWARPRATQDVDFKVMIERDSAQRLLDILESDYTPLQTSPLQMLQRNGVLFVKDQTDTRIDLQLVDVELDRSAIERAKSVELEPGVVARICSAEDLILYKLISTRLQDQIDVENIIRRQGDKLDDQYILDWLGQLEQALDDSTLIKTYQHLRHK